MIRLSRSAARAEAAAEAFLEEDQITSLSDLHTKLDRTCFPGGFIEVKKDDEMWFLGIAQLSNSGPKITHSLVINRVIVYDDDDYVASRQFFPAPNLVRKGLRGCP